MLSTVSAHLIRVDSASSEPLHRKVYGAVLDAIRRGDLVPGDRLPTEQVLARQLKMNRLTVRKGYVQLKDSGLVRQLRGSGSFVAEDALRHLDGGATHRLRSIAFLYSQDKFEEAGGRAAFIVLDVLAGLCEVLVPQSVRVCPMAVRPEQVDSTRPLGAWLDEFDAVVLQGKLAGRIPGPLLRWMDESGKPAVSTLMPSLFDTLPSVYYDRRAATAMAVDYLVARGCRRIGYVGRLHGGVSETKMAGFFDAVRRHGLSVDGRDQIHTDAIATIAYAAMRKRLAEGDPPDGVFADTDSRAFGVLAALRDGGLRVPQDVKVVGYDDMPGSDRADPPLTSVRPPRCEIGRAAAEILRRWPKAGPVPQSRCLGVTLVERQSA